MIKRIASACAAAILCLTLAGCNQTPAQQGVLKPETGYQAVFLQGGAVFFGHLSGLGTDYPVLTDVFYVQSGQNSETKQVTNVLIKRGKEWHAPDKMTLNAKHIIFVEPVGANSQVAKLIEQAK